MVSTLVGVEVRRGRLLAVSLAVAVVVGIGGGLIWAAVVDDEADAPVDAVLTDPQDATADVAGIEPNAVVEGEPLPDAVLSDRDGDEVPVSSFRGEPLVMNFWFSTCPPCAKELPDFAEVHAARGDEVRFIGVNTIDSVPVMERFAGERGVTYELYRDDLAELTDGIGATNFPVTIFVTSDGTIVEQTGVLDAAELDARIDDLLAREGAA